MTEVAAATETKNPNSTVKMIHVRMPNGEVLSIGHDYFTSEHLRANPQSSVTIRVACSVCSKKDQFSKKQAIANVRAKLAEGRFISAVQNTDKASWEATEKVVLAAFNKLGHELTPVSWERRYPSLMLVPNKQVRKVVLKNVVVAMVGAGEPTKEQMSAIEKFKAKAETSATSGV